MTKKLFYILLFATFLLSTTVSNAQTSELFNLEGVGGVVVTQQAPSCIQISITNEKDQKPGWARVMPKVRLENNCADKFEITKLENASTILQRTGNPPKIISPGKSWELFLYNQGFKIHSTAGDYIAFSSYLETWYEKNDRRPQEWWISEAEKDPDADHRARTLAALSHILIEQKNWEEAYFWASISISGQVKQALFEHDVASMHLNREQRDAIDKRVAQYLLK